MERHVSEEIAEEKLVLEDNITAKIPQSRWPLPRDQVPSSLEDTQRERCMDFHSGAGLGWREGQSWGLNSLLTRDYWGEKYCSHGLDKRPIDQWVLNILINKSLSMSLACAIYVCMYV